MKVGDLVRCRPRITLEPHKITGLHERENYDAWLGLIIGEPTNGTHKTVQWVCSDGRGDVETVNHTPEELWVVNESR